MKPSFNHHFLLWIIGILQPVSSAEILSYMEIVLEEAGKLPSAEAIKKLCMKQVKLKRIIRINRNPDLFSLTTFGNHYLTKEQRLSRDRLRLFLLKESRSAKLKKSCEMSASELGGDSPSTDERTSLKGREANKLGLSLPQGQAYWPRFSKQLVKQTGQSQHSHDADHIPFLSFNSAQQITVALHQPDNSICLDYQTLGLLLGISPQLIVQICRNPYRHYRQYSLAKKGGGERIISSPRTFLKLIQQFLLDYFFSGLPVHQAVHSYRQGRSIISNASQHVRKTFVSNIDIAEYFGSITTAQINNTLLANGFVDKSSRMLAHLCTIDNTLPQGAPTSPALSNTFLFQFDEQMTRRCAELGLSYTRYADDMTISGDEKEHIKIAIKFANKSLNTDFGLKLKREKIRIARFSGQQRVTGIVVNEAPRPPRKFRREVRAALHNASKAGTIQIDEINKLSGYISYLMSFDTMKDTKEVARYQAELRTLKTRTINNPSH